MRDKAKSTGIFLEFGPIQALGLSRSRHWSGSVETVTKRPFSILPGPRGFNESAREGLAAGIENGHERILGDIVGQKRLPEGPE